MKCKHCDKEFIADEGSLCYKAELCKDCFILQDSEYDFMRV